MKQRLSWVTVVAMVLALLPLATVGATGPHPNLTPEDVEAVVFPGQTIEVPKTAHTPVLPPLVDICLVEDETGSFGDDIANLQNLAPQLVAALDASGSDYATCVIGFRDFAQDNWGGSADWVYRRLADVGAGGAPLLTGVALLTAGGGADGPEAQLEALHYLATPGHAAIDSNGDGDTTDSNDTAAGLQPTWRPNAKRVVLLATDNRCHTAGDAGGWPGDTGTASALTTAGVLNTAGITVIGLTPGGVGYGCVDVLADNAAPGGSVQSTTSSGDDIVDAILAGLSNLPVAVGMDSNCDYPIGTEFVPLFENPVDSGDDALFTEYISVDADAPGGTYQCEDWMVINEEPITEPIYTVTNAGMTYVVAPLTTGETVVDYYGYPPIGSYSASSDRIDIEVSETSLLFLYEGADGLSLVALHDRPEGQLGETPATGGSVDMLFGNLPDTAGWAVRDDDPGNDAFPASPPGTLEANWVWAPCCTDGGAINGGLLDWLDGGSCVYVEPAFYSGIDEWVFLTGEAANPAAVELNMSEPVEICREPVIEHKTIKVPEGFLTGGGQIGKGSRGSNFGGNVGYLADFSIVGQWQFQGTAGSGANIKMHSTSIEYLQFSNNTWEPPDPPPANANVADFGGIARVKVDKDAWLDGCTFVAQAQDHGEPARKGNSDLFGIQIDCTGVGGGGPWTFGRDYLDAGNLQIHSGLKD